MVNKLAGHKAVLPMTYSKNGLDGFIAIHRSGVRDISLGATRLKNYQSRQEALKDALSLSRLMSYKAALANLSYGGAKGVIIYSSRHSKEKVLTAYADKLNSLGGKFITGTDMGLNIEDLRFLKEKTSFVVGLRNNPEEATAQGIFYSMEICLKEIFGSADVGGREVAIQGLGKVGLCLLNILYRRGAKIFASDPNPEKTRYIKRNFPKVKLVPPGEIIKQKSDIFSPCALGGVLDEEAVKNLRSKIIVGGANNQLASKSIGIKLYRKGILYAPDYVVNAGGLIAVADELENKKTNRQRLDCKLQKLGFTLKKVLEISRKRDLPFNLAADEMAEQKIKHICP